MDRDQPRPGEPESPGVYVYGLTRSADPAPAYEGPTIGDADAALGSIEHEGLRALASEVGPGLVRGSRHNLTAHSEVLAAALDRGPVLPMQFGVVFPDEQAVRAQLLSDHGRRLRAMLDELEGRVELTLKGYYVEEAVLREILAESPEAARLDEQVRELGAQAAYPQQVRLGEIVARGVEARRQHDTEWALQALEPLAEQVRVGDPAHERMALNLALLARRDALEQIDAAADELARAQRERIELRYVGPLPPHSFVELTLPPAGAY